MNKRAHRLPTPEAGKFPEGFDMGKIQYWKRKEDCTWMLYLPGGGFGNLAAHDVTEHVDGTITVSPSILVTSNRPGARARHGYLIHGEWQPCGDDEPPTEGS